MTNRNQITPGKIYETIHRLYNDRGIKEYTFTKDQIDQIYEQFRTGSDHEFALFKFNDMEYMPPDELMSILGLALMSHFEHESESSSEDDFCKLKMFYQNMRDLMSYIQREIYNYDVSEAMFEAMEN